MSKFSYKKMSLIDLITLSQNDDLKALEELLKREQKNIYTSLVYLSGNNDNVYDLTQEVLLKIAKNIKTLNNPNHFKSWVNQITTNVFYDDIRKNNKNFEVVTLDENEENLFFSTIKKFFVDKRCKPPEICISSELDKIIKYEILNLPEAFRIVIILRELEGLTYEEIALATKTNIGTVKSRISRARNKLQENLKAYL